MLHIVQQLARSLAPTATTQAAAVPTVHLTCQSSSSARCCNPHILTLLFLALLLLLQFDNTVNKTYFATNIINSTPTSMIAATAVCAAIGPLFLASYFVRDFMMRSKQQQ
jgi:hypothetical protein